MLLKKHDAIKGRFEGLRVDPRELRITPGFNVRDLTTPYAQEKLRRLKEKIRKHGVRDPLKVRMIGDEIHVVNGHRRHTVVMELINEGLDIQSVPIIQEAKGTSPADRDAGLIHDNDDSEPLTDLERAQVVRRLLNHGWSKDQIAEEMGYKSKASVENLEILLSAPQNVVDAIRQEEIAPNAAVHLIRAHGEEAETILPELQQQAAEAGKKRVRVRDVKDRIAASSPPVSATQTAADIERRNEQKLAEAQRETKSEGDLAKLERILAILADFEARGVNPQAVADAFGTRTRDQVHPAVEWLMEFEEALGSKEKIAAMASMIEKIDEKEMETIG